MLNNPFSVVASTGVAYVMNLPTGVTRVAGKSVKGFDARKELDELSAAGFSGYVVETLFGENGLEESALVYRQGQGMACVYEYYGSRHTLQGDEALVHCMNAFLAERGVLDVMDLSIQQVDLVTAFNPKLKLSKAIAKGQFRSLVKESFDATLSKKITASPLNVPLTKESLFKKFGLAGIEGGQ